MSIELPYAVTLVAALIAGCATPPPIRDAHLYPANDAAASNGVLSTSFVADTSGHGQFVLALPGGERVRGEYSVIRAGTARFGDIFAVVYGSEKKASVVGQIAGGSVHSGQGVATGFGDQGTRLDCEFLNENQSGHGYGACKLSSGALYKLQY